MREEFNIGLVPGFIVGLIISILIFFPPEESICNPCFSYFGFRDFDQSTLNNGTLYLRNGPRTVELTVSGGTLVTACGAGTCGTANVCSPGDDIKINSIPTTGDVPITINYVDCNSQKTYIDTAKIRNR